MTNSDESIDIVINGIAYTAYPKKEVIDSSCTGYEKASEDGQYYFSTSFGECNYMTELSSSRLCTAHFQCGNYYNDGTFAMNIIRAENLMRQLRQWQALNDNVPSQESRWHIEYTDDCLDVDNMGVDTKIFGTVYFSSANAARRAIEAFEDELKWYFTKFQQRMDEGPMAPTSCVICKSPLDRTETN